MLSSTQNGTRVAAPDLYPVWEVKNSAKGVVIIGSTDRHHGKIFAWVSAQFSCRVTTGGPSKARSALKPNAMLRSKFNVIMCHYIELKGENFYITLLFIYNKLSFVSGTKIIKWGIHWIFLRNKITMSLLLFRYNDVLDEFFVFWKNFTLNCCCVFRWDVVILTGIFYGNCLVEAL